MGAAAWQLIGRPMQQSTCNVCGNVVPDERVQILRELFPQHAITCTACSKVQQPLVLMDYSHKTAGVAFIVPTNPDGTRNVEMERKALRVYNRSR